VVLRITRQVGFFSGACTTAAMSIFVEKLNKRFFEKKSTTKLMTIAVNLIHFVINEIMKFLF